MIDAPSLVGVVEDSDDDYAMLCRVMREEAPSAELIRWTDAERCLEALTAPSAPRPEVLVLDLNLPGIDGAELVARLRGADDRLAALPAFVLSGSEHPDDIERSYAAGAAAYLTKPGNLAELRALVRMLLRAMATLRAPLARAAAAPSAAAFDRATLETEREAYETELRDERDARRQAEALQRLASRLADVSGPAEASRLLVQAIEARPGHPQARIVADEQQPASSEALVMPDPFGAGTIAMLPLRSPNGDAYGTLRVETPGELTDLEEAFLHSAVTLAGQAFDRLGRLNELVVRARVGAADLPSARWWNAAIADCMQRSQSSGRPLSLVVVLPHEFETFEREHGPVAGDARLLAIVDTWREAGYDLLSPSGAERWVAVVEDRLPAVRKLAASLAESSGTPPAFVTGVAEWDGHEAAERVLHRAAIAIGHSPQA